MHPRLNHASFSNRHLKQRLTALIHHPQSPPLILLIHHLLMHTRTRLPPIRTRLQISQRGSSRLTGTQFLHINEVDRGTECLAIPCFGGLGIELVDLFEGEAFGLVDAMFLLGRVYMVWGKGYVGGGRTRNTRKQYRCSSSRPR